MTTLAPLSQQRPGRSRTSPLAFVRRLGIPSRAALCCTLSLGAASIPGISDAHGPAQNHRAHVHGVAELNVALDGDTLLIELISPAMNLVGFEHAPRTADERAALQHAHEALEDGEALFVANQEAACELHNTRISFSAEVPSQMSSDAETQPNTPGQDTPLSDSGHRDLHAGYGFTCHRPAALERLTVDLFRAFPGTERLRVQLIAPDLQTTRELTVRDNQLDF